MRIIISLLVIVFSLHSCKEIPITPLNITKSLTLIGEKQVTNNSFGYSITKDSLLIMIAYGDADEKFIHVYDTAFNFKFSVGNKGKLFSEFNMPQFFNTNFIDCHDSIIHIFDINLLQEKDFNLTKFIQNPQPEKEIKGRYLPTKLYFTDNLNILNDSTFVGRSIDMNYGSFFIYNSRSKEKKWIKFNHKFRYPDKKYEDQSYLNSICVHPQKKKIIVAYRYFDLIQLYDDEGKLLQEHCFSKIQKPLLSTVASGMAPEASFYNLSICGTNKYCYILRANKTGIQLQNQPQKLSGQLIVMDWSGNIKNIYPCPELLYSICVDANDTYLFATIDNYNDLEYSFIRKYKL